MSPYTKYLKCEFTADEITTRARELAASNRKRADLEQEKKEIDSDLKGKIEAENTKIKRLSDEIAQGFEFRHTECRVELDTPAQGQKTVVRLDTGEVVSIERMTDEDRQMALALEEEAAKKDAEVIPESRQIDAPGTIVGDGFVVRGEIVVTKDDPVPDPANLPPGQIVVIGVKRFVVTEDHHFGSVE